MISIEGNQAKIICIEIVLDLGSRDFISFYRKNNREISTKYIRTTIFEIPRISGIWIYQPETPDTTWQLTMDRRTLK